MSTKQRPVFLENPKYYYLIIDNLQVETVDWKDGVCVFFYFVCS